MEVEALALETRGSQTSAAPAEEFAAAEIKASAAAAAGTKAEAEEAKSVGAAKKTMLVKVADDRIKMLLADPPNLTLSHRLRSFTEENAPFACSNAERRRAILDKLPRVADSIDKWNAPRLDILRQYHETGSAYEEIEVDEDNN